MARPQLIAAPCVDELGVPTNDDTCAMTVEARDFTSCTASGCHGTENAALTATNIATNRIAEIFWDTKGVATKKAPSNQAVGGELVVPA